MIHHSCGKTGWVMAIPLWAMTVAVMAAPQVEVRIGHHPADQAFPTFQFATIRGPSQGDAAAEASFALVEGRRDRNGGELAKLHDGYLPTDEDEPSENFFFAAGGEGGRIVVDLGAAIDIEQVNTFSWHPSSRGPQVYSLYAGTGDAAGFQAQPSRETDPATCGWALIAKVDTQPDQGQGGGQYGVNIIRPGGLLGSYRYLLFDIRPTRESGPFGNTFYSEIDVVRSGSSLEAAVPLPRPGRQVVLAGEGAYRIAIDTSETPDLTEWIDAELVPVVQAWYPKIVELLASEGYEAPRSVSIVFSATMRGVAATGGTRIRVAASWFQQNLKGEAKGSIVHELVHVVQQYGRAPRPQGNTMRPPGWLVEGIADYIRWFLYEPESKGAEISRRNLDRARYDASYRVSANFLNWVAERHGQNVITRLNAACREGLYCEDLWRELTGHSVEELGQEWKAGLEKKLTQE